MFALEGLLGEVITGNGATDAEKNADLRARGLIPSWDRRSTSVNTTPTSPKATVIPGAGGTTTSSTGTTREQYEQQHNIGASGGTEGVYTGPLKGIDKQQYMIMLAEAAKKKTTLGPDVVSMLKKGTFPFMVFHGRTKEQTIARLAKFYNESTQTLTVKKHPRKLGILDTVEAYAEKGFDALKDMFCSGTGQMAAQAGAIAAGGAAAPIIATASSLVCGSGGSAASPIAEIKGRIAFYHKQRKIWLVFKPVVNLGDAFAPPAGYEPDGEAATKPADASDGGIIDEPTYYLKQWWFWVAAGGGVAVLGTGAYFVFRKKRGKR